MGKTPLTPNQMEALLAFASAKLGISKEQLARSAQSGDPKDLGLSPEQNRRLEALTGGKENAESLLQSPQVRALLARLTDGEEG